jgi:hypothetical protein
VTARRVHRPARGHALAPGGHQGPEHTTEYSRLFPGLTPLAIDPARLRALGASGGGCDGTSAADEDGSAAAGWPFFGQYVAHDITADRSPLTHRADAEIRNYRLPRLNLECLYGAGPVGSPYLFDRDDPARLLLGNGGVDLPRNVQGVALAGDPRNDVHLFVNQLQVALIRAHNAFVDRVRADGTPPTAVFDEARRLLMWHYQWIVLHDFLPSVVGQELMDRLLAGGVTLQGLAESPRIPFEFADAAYRYGHAQIRQRYRVNATSGEVPLFPSLMGFRPVPPECAIDWALVFDLPGHPPAQRARRIDGRLPASLIALPEEVTGEVEHPADRSLAARDLERGVATALPSGEAIARALGVEPLDADEVGLDGWEGETPLWFYVLREAAVRGNGDRLGPVGGRIVAETLVAIVDADPESYRAVNPAWRPTFTREGFGLADLLLAQGEASVEVGR